MRRLTRTILVAVTLSLFSTIAMAGMGGGNLLSVGTKAPDFSFTDLNGTEGSLYDTKKGEPLLLVFLQRTCRSCQREMEFLKEFKAEYDKLNVLAVFLDAVDRDLKGFVSENEFKFRFLWDADYEIADQYGVSFTPTSFLLDNEKKVVSVYRGWSRKGHKVTDDVKALDK